MNSRVGVDPSGADHRDETVVDQVADRTESGMTTAMASPAGTSTSSPTGNAVRNVRSEFDDTPGYLYDKMADHIADRIRSGELRPNTLLPSERDLAEQYEVSLGTARHAGLVVTVRSKGTYVRPPAPEGESSS